MKARIAGMSAKVRPASGPTGVKGCGNPGPPPCRGLVARAENPDTFHLALVNDGTENTGNAQGWQSWVACSLNRPTSQKWLAMSNARGLYPEYSKSITCKAEASLVSSSPRAMFSSWAYEHDLYVAAARASSYLESTRKVLNTAQHDGMEFTNKAKVMTHYT